MMVELLYDLALSLSTLYDWLTNNRALVQAFSFFLFLIIIFHVAIGFDFVQISGIVWKKLDYVWYIPAVFGIVVSYYTIRDRDLQQKSDNIYNFTAVQVDFLREAFIGASTLYCEMPVTIIQDQHQHPMVRPPPDEGAPASSRSKPSLGFYDQELCARTRRIGSLIEHWRNNLNWPHEALVRTGSGLGYTTDVMIGFDEIKMRVNEFDEISASSKFGTTETIVDSIESYLQEWTDLRTDIEQAAPVKSLAGVMYWVLAFAAAVRITKIYGEIKNARLEQASPAGETERNADQVPNASPGDGAPVSEAVTMEEAEGESAHSAMEDSGKTVAADACGGAESQSAARIMTPKQTHGYRFLYL